MGHASYLTCYPSVTGLFVKILDKIFALLGLANDSKRGPMALEVDYSKSVAEVYRDVIRFLRHQQAYQYRSDDRKNLDNSGE